ncbi:hypothetical protein [Tenacibaculum sp. 190130A14a]|uniref:hypothetical protein n=1 Tax=Tenacibaculum polynesiense TaxID=3137857 RepID=UPI0032B1CDB2
MTLIVFCSCKKQHETPKNDVKAALEERYFFDCKKKTINGTLFEACIKRPGNFTVVNAKGETVYQNKENPFDFEFSDFNGDGYSDIKMNYVSNTPGLQELLLFDKESNSFVEVQSFNKFPNSKRIQETEFYYSYRGAGCADYDWKSELFKITESQITVYGIIKGFSCLENETNGIYIYKIIDSEKKLLKYIKRDHGNWNKKWDFIEKYWTENLTKFE